MQTEQGDCPASRPGLRGAKVVLSLLCGLCDSWVEGREGPAAKVSGPPLSRLTLIFFVGGATGESGGTGTQAQGELGGA